MSIKEKNPKTGGVIMRKLLLCLLAVGLFFTLSFNSVVDANEPDIIVPGYKIINAELGEKVEEEITVYNNLNEEVEIQFDFLDWRTEIDGNVHGMVTYKENYENSLQPYLELPSGKKYTIPANSKLSIPFNTQVPEDVEKDCLWTGILISPISTGGKAWLSKIIQSNSSSPPNLEAKIERNFKESPIGIIFDVVIKNNSQTDAFYPVTAMVYNPKGEIVKVDKDLIFTENPNYSIKLPENSNINKGDGRRMLWTIFPAYIPAEEERKFSIYLKDEYIENLEGGWYKVVLKPTSDEIKWKANSSRFDPQRFLAK